jgi:hypothetical protein
LQRGLPLREVEGHGAVFHDLALQLIEIGSQEETLKSNYGQPDYQKAQECNDGMSHWPE